MHCPNCHHKQATPDTAPPNKQATKHTVCSPTQQTRRPYCLSVDLKKWELACWKEKLRNMSHDSSVNRQSMYRLLRQTDVSVHGAPILSSYNSRSNFVNSSHVCRRLKSLSVILKDNMDLSSIMIEADVKSPLPIKTGALFYRVIRWVWIPPTSTENRMRDEKLSIYWNTFSNQPYTVPVTCCSSLKKESAFSSLHLPRISKESSDILLPIYWCV